MKIRLFYPSRRINFSIFFDPGAKSRGTMSKNCREGSTMRTVAVTIAIACVFGAAAVHAEPVRGAYPSANVQFLPAFVALEKGLDNREGLEPGLISVRCAVTAVQARLGNQIHFIFSVG